MIDEQGLKLIDELIRWNKFNMYVDLNDISNHGCTHGEGKAYGKGHYDYGVVIDKKLNELKEKLVKK
jgi:hypothetical protein